MSSKSSAKSTGDDASDSTTPSFYLMKAEPDSRIVKGKEVKFSVDDFEAARTTAWEGVRNFEARNLMQGMRVGDKVLFYHSNTKNPGIAAFAEVSKAAYPDSTAWDETHPYYDAKTDPSSPKWYMVDLRFVSRISHFVPLSLLRHLSSLHEIPEQMPYLQAKDLQAIKEMALLNKGRLSVQRVEPGVWDTINKIAKNGDGGIEIKRTKKTMKGKGKAAAEIISRKMETGDDGESGDQDDVGAGGKGKRRKTDDAAHDGEGSTRRSKRVKK